MTGTLHCLTKEDRGSTRISEPIHRPHRDREMEKASGDVTFTVRGGDDWCAEAL
jgi:hypothetical protein